MKAKLIDNYSKAAIYCSIKAVEARGNSMVYLMDSKKCNECNISEYDQECCDYKISQVEILKSGKVRVWAKYRTNRGNWTQGLQVVDAELISVSPNN